MKHDTISLLKSGSLYNNIIINFLNVSFIKIVYLAWNAFVNNYQASNAIGELSNV